MEHGFTRSFRAKWAHPVFRNLRDAAVWAWLTDSAAWRETKVRFCERLITLSRGQIVTSERFVADGFCVDRQVIRRLLDTLEREQMITREKTHGGTIITICNYDKYQSSQQHENPQENPGETQEEPKANPNKKEGKEGKEENNNLEFETWYSAYPLRKSRGQALKAYNAARKKTDAATLLAGIETYKKTKPDYAAWAHPASWLNAERWLDEAPKAEAAAPTADPERILQDKAGMVRKGIRSTRTSVTDQDFRAMLERGLVNSLEAYNYGYRLAGADAQVRSPQTMEELTEIPPMFKRTA